MDRTRGLMREWAAVNTRLRECQKGWPLRRDWLILVGFILFGIVAGAVLEATRSGML